MFTTPWAGRTAHIAHPARKPLAAVLATALLGAGLLVAVPGAAAAPVHKPKLSPPSYAVAAESPDWVSTPPGLAYKACVHPVPSGAQVSEDGVVTVKGKVVATLPECPYDGIVKAPKSANSSTNNGNGNGNNGKGNTTDTTTANNGNGNGNNGKGNTTDTTTANNGNNGNGNGNSGKGNAKLVPGWWLDSWWAAPAAVTDVSARWTVPADPAKNGALVYLFPSVTPAAGDRIVQPVLQWGSNSSFGGNYWTISSWYVGGGTVLYSTPQKVAAGHALLGTMTWVGGTGAQWAIQTTDLTSGATTGLSANTGVTTWNTVQGGVLEVPVITACNQLPAAGSVAFTNVTVSTATGSAPAFGTQAHVVATPAQCGGTATATSTTTTLTWTAK